MYPLAGPIYLPNLEEVRLSGIQFEASQLGSLADAPLLKQLRHFAIDADYDGVFDASFLVDAIDPERIETLAIRVGRLPVPVVKRLRSRLGDRLRSLD